ALEILDLLLLAEVALARPGVLLAVGAAMAGGAADQAAQLGDVAVAERPILKVGLAAGGGVVGGRRGGHGPFGIILVGTSGRPAATGRRIQIATRDPGAHRGDEIAAVLGRALAERVRDAQVLDRLGRNREVGRRQLLELAVLGQHERAGGPVGREAPLGRRRVEHHREAGPAAGRDADDVAPAERGEDPAGLRALGGAAAPGRAALLVGEPAAQPRVLEEVASVAADLAGELVGGLLDPAQSAGQPDHAPVGLELGEARLEERGGALPAGPAG